MNTTNDLNQSINLKFLFTDKKAQKYDLFRRDSANILLSKLNNKNLKEKEKIINNFDKKPLQLISERIILDKIQNIPSSNVS